MVIIVLPIVGVVIFALLATKGGPWTAFISAIFVFLASGLLGSLVLFLLFVALLVYLLVYPSLKLWRPKLLYCLLGLYLLALGTTFSVRLIRLHRLKGEYPFVSLSDRLKVRAEPVVANFPDVPKSYGSGFRHRELAIRDLHSSAIFHFLEAPEFGVMRMSYDPITTLKNDDESPIVLKPYSDCLNLADFEAGEKYHSKNASGQDELVWKHSRIESWFATEERNGEFKDVDHVAGFLPHAITDQSKANYWQREPSDLLEYEALTLNRLQLVGLLYHDNPVVYDLETTPTMVNAETAPTRPLDEFENRALEILKAGEPVYYESDGKITRMLGAIINADSCTKCHPGPNNQLLGAFSYVLTSKSLDSASNAVAKK